MSSIERVSAILCRLLIGLPYFLLILVLTVNTVKPKTVEIGVLGVSSTIELP